ncbi:bidirectional sugar transporter SWEET15-like [Glycine soja]|uniref:Bidirectional sugar transporter SWEET n=1 Tax=Glycine soja TaxID=3848 RepID=A0A445GP91_GLYSO|nr:bidirectional sugar transporter SWEET15-like [Glycine soja]KHN33482.1 Bidirectional sugar transporter SWEET15 [Glycine soja]RZB63125.1 Bidirectional sugar transporter SWEET15 [Glycine soja]
MPTHHASAAIFGIIGNMISVMVYLAPVPTFYQIYKKKCTDGFHSLPYLLSLMSSMLWLYYAFLKIHDGVVPLITINSIGCVIELIYILTYIKYAHKDARNLTYTLFAAMNIAFLTLVLSSHFALHGSHRVKVIGWICDAVSLSVFASPLSIMAKVIRTKSVQFMPFYLSFFLTLNAITWFVYGLSIQDKCIYVPNVGGFGLGLVQMVLYGIYRNGGESEKEQALAEGVINIVVVNPLGPAEVFPIAVEVDDDKVKEGLVVDQEKDAKD